jgi:hypothetical protein
MNPRDSSNVGPIDPADAHFLRSSYRESLVEHLFLAQLLRYLWCNGPDFAEVLRPEVDDAGFDLALQHNSILRHVQLKSSSKLSRTARQNVNTRLARKPSGCVIWLRFDPDTLELGPYLFFGGTPGEPLPPLGKFSVARHTKGDSLGRKKLRPRIRVVPKGAFQPLPDLAAVARRLFDLPP